MTSPLRPARTSPGPAARNPGLLLIAHGSRDPRHARAMSALAEAVRAAEPETAVEVGFLDLCGPSVAEAYGRLLACGGGSGHSVRAVPLFLKAGYHVRQDVPQALVVAQRAFPALIRLSVSAALGPDPLLTEAFERRIREAGGRPGDPRCETLSAGATRATELDPARLAEPLPAGADHRIVLAQFLAPGLLPDRAAARAMAAGVAITEPLISETLGPADELVRLVVARYRDGETAAAAETMETVNGSLIPSV